MCKILPMTKFTDQKELQLWIDCIPLDKVGNVKEKRMREGFVEIPDQLSKDLQINDHDCWIITLGGLFSLPQLFRHLVYQVHVQFIGEDNHSLVPIHLEFETDNIYGIAELRRETTLKDNLWGTFATRTWLLQQQSNYFKVR